MTVACYASLKPLLECGYVTEPLGATELGEVFEAVQTAGRSDLLIVFSPAGWADNVPAPDGTVLVAPGKNGAWQVRSNITDEGLQQFVRHLFDVETDADKIARCVEAITHASPAGFPLSAQQMATELALPLELIVDSFRHVTSRKGGYVLCDDAERGDWLLELH